MNSMNQDKPVTSQPDTLQHDTFQHTALQPASNLFGYTTNASGPLRFNMTNDYMFRAVLQTNIKVLRGLVCSLLHLSEKDVVSVEITNPVILGESIKDKEFRMDINVRLNNYSLINLEMQVAERMDWQNRSLVYLCRSFDQLEHGQEYIEAQPVIHIGFLDYTLFKESPEFYATYKLINVKNHKLYSDNFTLSVVDLSQIDLATDEDKKYQIDCWARLFKAATWEEIHMLASENNYIAEASETMFRLSADENIRKRCQDREDYYKEIRTYNKIIAEKDACITEQKNSIAEKDACITEQKNSIAEKDANIAEKDTLINKLLEEIRQLKESAGK